MKTVDRYPTFLECVHQLEMMVITIIQIPAYHNPQIFEKLN
jgi:hypothetical protein